MTLTGLAIQTLEDLRKAADAAWLWDGMRGRLVWANAAGIAAFDGQSVFDLIDRVFDPLEAGIVEIAALTKTLKRDEIKRISLEFPSAGRADAFECHCWLHTLADGRPGLVVVSPAPRKLNSTTNEVFAQLPVAAVLLFKDGMIAEANTMAATMFDAAKHRSLADILGDADRAEKILGRLQATNLVSAVETFDGLYGKREARLTLRRLAGDNEAFAILVMDDITERRNMERQLLELPRMAEPAKPTQNDAQAFEAIARSLNDAIGNTFVKPAFERATVELAAAKPEPSKPAALPVAAQPPRAIVNALEGSGAALIIAQGEVPVYASQKALQLLGLKLSSELFQNSSLLKKIFDSPSSNCALEIESSEKQRLSFAVSTSSIPWINGPARQFILSVAKPAEKLLPAVVATETTVPEVPIVVVEAAPLPIVQITPADNQERSSLAAEAELNSILDIASDGIVTLDQNGNILSFSAGAESLFGYRSAEVKAKPLANYFTTDSRKILQQYFAGLHGPGLGAVFNDGREVMAVVKQGGTVPLFLTIGKLQNHKSGAAFCAVMRDITSWKRTEKELREAKENAEAASKQKSEFLARISHELRTPLNAIMGFSDVMRLGQFGEIRNDKYRGYVNDIHASGSHLLALIDDLLDLSKIEAGKMELNFTAVNIAECADHAIKLLQETATRGRVLVRKSFPEKLPRVVADLRAMRQVFSNLLSNAIKFTDPGGQVIISAAVAPSGELTVKLKDTGIGMNAAQILDALEPFKRVETAGRETQGTGLGLPLTKALVEANRAKFALNSEQGQGTLIEITFPTTRVLAE
jgi:PAS domain S-box-containing protein